MSYSHQYSQVLIVLLAMLLMLVFQLTYEAKSFRLPIAFKVFGWAMVVLLCVMWLVHYFIG